MLTDLDPNPGRTAFDQARLEDAAMNDAGVLAALAVAILVLGSIAAATFFVVRAYDVLGRIEPTIVTIEERY